MTKGLITYIPPEMDEEVRFTMSRLNLKNRSDAFRVIVHNSRMSQDLLKTMEFHTKNFWIKNNRRK